MCNTLLDRMMSQEGLHFLHTNNKAQCVNLLSTDHSTQSIAVDEVCWYVRYYDMKVALFISISV